MYVVLLALCIGLCPIISLVCPIISLVYPIISLVCPIVSLVCPIFSLICPIISWLALCVVLLFGVLYYYLMSPSL